jgi:hypothetical protein
MTEENVSLINLVFKDGQFYEVVQHRNSETEEIPFDPEGKKKQLEDESFEDRFANTNTIPGKWKPPQSDVLIRKPDPQTEKMFAQLTDKDCRARAMKIEALLYEVLSVTNTNKGYYHTRGSTALQEVLIKLCTICGGEWEQKIPYIIADDDEII